jgi:hypothetical protein
MTLQCHVCGSSIFRTSQFRFKLSDFVQLLLLRLPVRCLNCEERAFISLRKHFAVRRGRKARRREKSGIA